ncbi:MAG: cytochrome c [Haloferula sp.]|uniref:c-type cytochrome n=1 Tax=Haloferula sp. TaxID=2497595 RepID=UPI00329C8D79
MDPIPAATPEMALEMGVEQDQLARGRELYMANCARCHERVLPGKMDPEYWRGVMPHMGENAELSKSQETDVLIYLMAAHGTVHGMNLEH